MNNQALSLFLQRIQSLTSLKSNYQVLADVIRSCAVISDISLGKSLHSHVIKLGHDTCQRVSKALLNMYAKCKALDDCQKLFTQTKNCDTVMWNIALSGFAGLRGYDTEVMRLFYLMHTEGNDTKPSDVTLAVVLPMCARNGYLSAGKSLHSYAMKCGLGSHTLVGNALVSMYAKCGDIADASSVFYRIDDKDVVSWNAIIAGYAENELMDDAFRLFQSMMRGAVLPNYATIVNVLPICSRLKATMGYQFGKQIHSYVVRRTELQSEVTVVNALLSFYLRLGRTEEAEILFRNMKFKDLVSWNAIIAGYSSNGQWLRALELFNEFVRSQTIGPDSVTLISILPVCGQLSNLKVGKQVHGYVMRHRNLQNDTAVHNALVSFYAKCGCTEAALRTFLSSPKRDLISWNAMLDAFGENQFEDKFFSLLKWMFREEIKPDSITILTLIQFCATLSRADLVKEAHGFSIRSGYLLSNTEPTLGNALLDSYAKCGSMVYASRTFDSLLGKRNMVTCNSMISGYMNCGSLDDALEIFEGMPERDITTWNLMVRGCADNSCPGQAISLFQRLQCHGMKPDDMSIMSFLPVCVQMASIHMLKQCHGIVVRACFEDVHLKGALLDAYSKCGSLDSAYKIFHSTPNQDLVIFTAMIGGYAMHGMGKQALLVFYNMLELGLQPDHVIITAVLSACSHAGLVDEGLKIFDSMEKVHEIKPSMEQYACVVDLLARGGHVKDAYSFVTQMPVEANANIWGTLLGACKTHHEVDLGRLVADRLFEVNSNDIGNYVVMSNLYAANARWDGVLEIRRLLKTRDLQKPAGCSWIEVEKGYTCLPFQIPDDTNCMSELDCIFPSVEMTTSRQQLIPFGFMGSHFTNLNYALWALRLHGDSTSWSMRYLPNQLQMLRLRGQFAPFLNQRSNMHPFLYQRGQFTHINMKREEKRDGGSD